MADFEEKFGKNRKPQTKKGAKGGSSKMRGLPKDSPQIKLSKTITWLLRHGANREGLSIRPDGYVPVEEIVRATLALLNISNPDAPSRWQI
jgi:2'-phosphotransferase